MSRQEAAAFRLNSRWVGGLPLVNAVVRQLPIDPLLHQAVPVRDTRVRIPPAQVLRTLILNQRQPLYTQGEWAARADPALLGLPAGSGRRLSDDQMGRALDQLFRADRASLLTRVVVGAVRMFQLELDELPNDSTTVTFVGDAVAATGAPAGGRPTPRITHGHHTDHRPDLKP